MEDQPNYQPKEQNPQTDLSGNTSSKKSSKKVIIVTVVLIIVTALVAVGATWYCMDNKQKDQQATNQKQVEQLKSEASALKNKEATVKPSTTPTPTSTTAKNDVEVLKAFCKSLQPKSTIDPVIFYQGTSGNFGKCGVDGGQIITAYVNNAWVKVYEGNGVFEDVLCVKYKIPYSIMTSCKGTY
jgi:type II secretory pathway pseudopilin PulG